MGMIGTRIVFGVLAIGLIVGIITTAVKIGNTTWACDGASTCESCLTLGCNWCKESRTCVSEDTFSYRGETCYSSDDGESGCFECSLRKYDPINDESYCRWCDRDRTTCTYSDDYTCHGSTCCASYTNCGDCLDSLLCLDFDGLGKAILKVVLIIVVVGLSCCLMCVGVGWYMSERSAKRHAAYNAGYANLNQPPVATPVAGYVQPYNGPAQGGYTYGPGYPPQGAYGQYSQAPPQSYAYPSTGIQSMSDPQYPPQGPAPDAGNSISGLPPKKL